ncbi:MAG: class I SAM-dependent rRNA methyltransferase [Vicinamibacteria bacterium]|nr:class I SAM-dependent rRNA methyltransferase [Vicinamibacteria bacterium]
MNCSTVFVGSKGQIRINAGHPWVFRSDIRAAGDARPGDVVRVSGPHGRHLGFAFFSSRSEITLRMLTREAELSEHFLEERIAAALSWRRIIAAGADAYRIIHGEGDGLPSFIVDRYGDFVVIQTLSQAGERLKARLVEALLTSLHPRGVIERNDPRVRLLEGLDRRVGVLHGTVPEIVEIDESGVLFQADLYHGQKTGLFLDQRENHVSSREYAHGRVLDAFTYNGGFGLHAARSAAEVVAVDVSTTAVARVARNADRNGLNNVVAREANVFDLLRDFERRGELFDTVFLDPPAFAKSRDAVDKARRGYNEINRRALRLLAPGGCLVTCSCSYHVSETDFEALIEKAALDAGVSLQFVEKRRQARDHPIIMGVPETHYLKCFILRRTP